MKTLEMKCTSCDGALQITPEMDQFTCGYCGTAQIVQRSGGTVVLKPVAKVAPSVKGESTAATEMLASATIKPGLQEIATPIDDGFGRRAGAHLVTLLVCVVSSLVFLLCVIALVTDGYSYNPVAKFGYLIGSAVVAFFTGRKAYQDDVAMRKLAIEQKKIPRAERVRQIVESRAKLQEQSKSDDFKSKEAASSIGIVAVGLGLASIVMPYFAAVLFVPAAFICGSIAFRQGDKKRGGIALVLAVIGLLHIINVSNQIGDAQKDLERSLRSLR